jgi:tetratricopeptide (TPR) repeat protein
VVRSGSWPIQRVLAAAVQHHKAARLDEAEDLYREILTHDSRHADSLHLLGVATHQKGSHDAAVELISRAITINPRVSSYHSNLAAVLKERGRLDEAITCLNRSIALKPDAADAHKSLAVLFKEQGRLDESVACFRRLVDLRPGLPDAHHDLGNALRAQGRLEEAIVCYRAALNLNTDLPGIHNSLGNSLMEVGRWDEAVVCYHLAHALRPQSPDANNNLGNGLVRQGRLDEAVACYGEAISLNPDFAEAHRNLGTVLKQQMRLDEAAAAFRRAIELNPDDADAHNHLAMTLLAQGEMAAGWEELEWRWKTSHFSDVRRRFTQPRWRGEPAAGRTLLIYAEQGLGDTLQFCRYAQVAVALGFQVILEVQQPLVRLLKALPGVGRVVVAGETLPAFDLHCPMLSLPLALRTTLATIPGAGSYVCAGEAQAAAWQIRLAAMATKGLRVGLVWAGNPRSQSPALASIDGRRSLAPHRLASLLDVPGVHFFSLQKDGPAAPASFSLTDFMPEMTDFADTAALIVNLDLVISVDTAVAHLAGALGKPVWLLDRFDSCWRWLTERRDSPWYPSLRAYRQPRPGDWETVLSEVVRDLRTFADAHGSPPGRMRQGGSAIRLLVAEALQHHQAGRLKEAEDRYRQVLVVDPDHADALHLLGVATHQIGRHDDAVSLIRQAINISPETTSYFSNLAVVFKEQGRLEEAIACMRRVIERKPQGSDGYKSLANLFKERGCLDEAIACLRKIVALDPNLPDGHNDLGRALRTQGQLAEAIASYRAAIKLAPNLAGVHNNLGAALQELGQLEEAVASYRRALELKPDFPEAHNNLAILFRHQGRLDEVIACFQAVVVLTPYSSSAHENLGSAFKEGGRLDEAIICYRKAIEIKPEDPKSHNNFGVALLEQGRSDEAIFALRRAMELKPDYQEAHNNLGNALMDQERLNEAVAHYGIAIELKPNHPAAHMNLGNALRTRGVLDEAIACYRKANELQPDHPLTRLNLAMAMLAQGDMAAGWEEYEWRWQAPEGIKEGRGFLQPQWKGEAAAGRTLLIHAEQGFGDTLQFCRYAPMAGARGLRVILEVQPLLVQLLRGLPGVERVIARGERLPEFDLQCPMLSMPLAVGTTIATIPGAEPYLHAHKTQVTAWRTHLAAMPNQGLRVGLVWAGNPRLHVLNAAAIDRRRSLAPDRLARWLDMPGVHFFSLQKDGPAAPDTFPLTDFMRQMKNFADTAALIANLDLVIAVDTAVAHLSAALGKPVWLLDRFDPCWRWIVGRRDSPWYPTLRIYRQPRPGDWDSVLAEVTHDLRRLLVSACRVRI